MKDLTSLIGAIVLVVGLIVGSVYGYITLYRDAAPRMTDAERATYENSVSYVQGKIQELTKYRLEYQTVNSEEAKVAIKTIILHTASTVNTDKLPADLQAFIRDLRNGR